MAGQAGLLKTLRHRDFALLMGSFTTSAIGSWAYNVALVVWLLDETGSAGWVAASTVARFVPALLLSAYGGVIADRFEQVRLMAVLDTTCFLVMLVLAAETAVGVHPALAIATAALVTSVETPYQPAATALTPRVVPESELGAANALRNAIDNITVIAGPGLAGLMLVVAAPWVAIVFNAVTFLVSAIFVVAVKVRSTPVDVTESGEAGPLRQMLVGISTIGSSSSTLTLVAFSVVATFVFGMDTVLFVLLSDQVLGTGAEGYGYLLAGLGVGGIVAAGLVARLERLPRLGSVILLGMAGYCLPYLLFLVVDQPLVGFIAQCVRGASTLVVDVLALTALQRSVPHDRLARVFGAFDGLVILAVLLGSLSVPPLLDVVGLDGVLWTVGLVIPAMCLLGLPRLRRMDEEAEARRTRLASKISLLQGSGLFGSVGEGSVEQLAGESDYLQAAADQVVVREGDAADALYVIEAGDFAVSSRGEAGGEIVLRDMGPGEYFGEIGVIEGGPRTATVTARGPGRLLRVRGPAFIDALTQGAPSAALLDGASARLGRTHPSRTLTRAALHPDT
jgi:CRP-like cAMP-binding protein/predicted MFS family arabinose efflux permease